ncbi:MAG: acyl-CoA carboxylase subunit epsilon, partial [Pseudonocardiales bacterium]|nr:acyl-CoA carboxylase subunit epsilon [Pseudonocardiales bacterium]
MSHLRIVRGNPTDAEVAALVAALASVQRCDAAAATGPAPAAPPAGWS